MLRYKIDRPLQGQSPYVLNLGLLYDLEKYGIQCYAYCLTRLAKEFTW